MAVTTKPSAEAAMHPFTVLRPFYWGGEVVEIGTTLKLTAAQSAELLSATKIAPGEVFAVEAKAKSAAVKAKADDTAKSA